MERHSMVSNLLCSQMAQRYYSCILPNYYSVETQVSEVRLRTLTKYNNKLGNH